MEQEQNDKKAERRIWLPGPHNFLISLNDNYIHSFWLGTGALILSLPVSLCLHILLPILHTLGAGGLGIVVILANMVHSVVTIIGSQIWRALKLFLYGIFGYLNTISNNALQLWIEKAQLEMLASLAQQEIKDNSGKE